MPNALYLTERIQTSICAAVIFPKGILVLGHQNHNCVSIFVYIAKTMHFLLSYYFQQNKGLFEPYFQKQLIFIFYILPIFFAQFSCSVEHINDWRVGEHSLIARAGNLKDRLVTLTTAAQCLSNFVLSIGSMKMLQTIWVVVMGGTMFEGKNRVFEFDFQ